MVFTDYTKAKTAAEAAGKVVLGTCRHGEAPTYLIVDPEVDELTARNTAFEHVRGRPIASQEEVLLKLVEMRGDTSVS